MVATRYQNIVSQLRRLAAGLFQLALQLREANASVADLSRSPVAPARSALADFHKRS
jgi:hypothetical protein